MIGSYLPDGWIFPSRNVMDWAVWALKCKNDGQLQVCVAFWDPFGWFILFDCCKEINNYILASQM
jgi:hypothetical protein